MLKKSHIACFCKGRESLRLYIGFKFFFTRCTNQKHFKLIFYSFIFSYTLVLEYIERKLNIFFGECGCIGALGRVEDGSLGLMAFL